MRQHLFPCEERKYSRDRTYELVSPLLRCFRWIVLCCLSHVSLLRHWISFPSEPRLTHGSPTKRTKTSSLNSTQMTSANIKDRRMFKNVSFVSAGVATFMLRSNDVSSPTRNPTNRTNVKICTSWQPIADVKYSRRCAITSTTSASISSILDGRSMNRTNAAGIWIMWPTTNAINDHIPRRSRVSFSFLASRCLLSSNTHFTLLLVHTDAKIKSERRYQRPLFSSFSRRRRRRLCALIYFNGVSETSKRWYQQPRERE